ncbi:Unknown protein [Striga hermonthica]|uniref:Uncharacterized protein n=1 Tax=Striga hermonthica TaxID=68872 RepID=A0A9N7NXQ4_STRHE|nr:Unknown protein [Striga hermonthica]
MYLDQLSNSTDHHNYNHQYQDKNGQFVKEHDRVQHDDDEDMSMISDASSGPPHFHPNDATVAVAAAADAVVYSQYYGYYTPSFYEDTNNITNKSNAKESVSRSKKHHNLCLDDTASSPIYDFSQDNVAPSSHEYSQVYSGANLEGEYSRTKKHFGFFKSSTKGKSGSFLGRKRQ